jgi:Zn-dependent protease
MRFTFSIRELKEMGISAFVLGFVFAWYFDKGIPSLGSIFNALVAVGAAFILHETAHKLAAQKYGCWAEYKMWETGLIIAFFSVILLDIVFAAPGAVYITPGYYGITKRENGIISISGPLTNILLALIFHFLNFKLGVIINAWLAFFNMIPFPPLDGSKVIAWSIPNWAAICLLALILMSF